MPQSKRNALQPLDHTRRWISGTLGVGAALATILASAHSCGLIGDQTTHLSVANLAVSWVGLSPASDTARSLDDTLRYVATVTDRRGTALVGAAIEWRTENPSIATVDSGGFVVARAPGTTAIIAMVADKIARSRVVVRQRPASFDFGLDSVVRVPEGGSQTVVVRALDGRGHPLPRARAALHVGDTAVAAVTGAAQLAGRATGRTALMAELDGARDSIGLLVVPVPGHVTVIRGSNQHSAGETRLPEPVVVRVGSRMGHPMPGVVVHFSATEGSGAVRPDSAFTDGDGLATAFWTTGDRPGLESLLATVVGVDSGATPLAEVEPSRANTRVVALGDPPSGLAAGAEPVVVAVQLTDSSGRVLPGVPVNWKPLDGGRITGRELRSDSVGEAHAQWWLGRRAGVQRAKVLVGSGRSVPPITLVAAGFPGAPNNLIPLSATELQGTVASTLPKPLMARVTDSVGNGVPGVPIAVTGPGVASESLAVSDSTGRAAIRWMLGEKAGAQTLTLAVDGVAPLRFAARARPGPPTNVGFVEPEATGRAGRPLGKSVRVRATDAYGNPVPAAPVAFAASAGSVRPARVTTGDDGLATTTWVLGRQGSRQTLTVTLDKKRAKDSMEVVAVGAAPAAAVSSRTQRKLSSIPPPAKLVPAVRAASR